MDKKPVQNLKLVEYSNSSSSDSDGEQEKPKKIRKIAVILPQIAPCPVHGNSPDSSPPPPPDQNNYDLDLDLEMAMDIQNNVETTAETETSGMPQNANTTYLGGEYDIFVRIRCFTANTTYLY